MMVALRRSVDAITDALAWSTDEFAPNTVGVGALNWLQCVHACEQRAVEACVTGGAVAYHFSNYYMKLPKVQRFFLLK